MGTNYYLEEVVDDLMPCVVCGRPYDNEPVRLHIGKSSAGWVFAFRAYIQNDPTYTSEHKRVFGEQGPSNYQLWMSLLADTLDQHDGTPAKYRIRDEYGQNVSLIYFLQQVHHRSWNTREYTHRDDTFLRRNNARVGRNNLLFSSATPAYYAKNFTYYYRHGEFS
mgnify:CR=1 FL=1